MESVLAQAELGQSNGECPVQASLTLHHLHQLFSATKLSSSASALHESWR